MNSWAEEFANDWRNFIEREGPAEWRLDVTCTTCHFPVRVVGIAKPGEHIHRTVTCPNCGTSWTLDGQV